MLEIRNLSKSYGTKQALKHFTYIFNEGLYGMLGANGAGKSTLMNLITDNVARESGEILYNGREILRMGAAFRELVGYMPQQQGFYENFSAKAFLMYIANLKGIRRKTAKEQVGEVLDVVHLSEVADKKIGGLSGGMRQRVLLAQALLGSPYIVILDEPMAGLDPKERVNLRSYIAELSKNRCVLLATHLVGDIEAIADEVLLIKDGVLVQDGKPNELVACVGGNNLEDVYMHYFN